MSEFFNKQVVLGLLTGHYYCDECGALMEFEDEDIRDTLICPKCGYETDLDHYGLSEDEYDALYPTYEKVIAEEEAQKNQVK